MSWEAWADDELHRIAGEGRWRRLRSIESDGPVTGRIGERRVISFASNDYLGLSAHPEVIAAAHSALDRWGAGAGSARLIAGTRPVHVHLEAALAEWKQTESAVLFPSGYMANLAAVTTFADSGTRVLSDALNHASIVDACRLSGASVEIYPHRDLDALEDALRRPGRTLVVTESAFSMDGDVSAVDVLVDICRRHGALLVLDEAHAVLGPEPPPYERLLRVGTLSKALGSVGGFIAGPTALVDLVVNRGRSFIFTTAPAPASSAAALAAVELLRGATGDALVQRLRVLVDRIRPGHPSPIIPLVIGSEQEAMARSDRLLEQGLLVPAIRPPSVPPGTSRLRVSLSAAHTDDHVDALLAALPELSPVQLEA